ncbi:hypothetical protein [Streptomyces kanamyceticus]|uniref:Uncharacterized protein n=1 Tax=Streptomyces kanamyceticus TaxID=1967 RepID=A0A5J6GA27_STRKN|nr:hypothetical protein [Streptomyces kanamyceticus]QEU90106.1 hypothetical protein CP970_03555 [Streptomyces kanamyceticus]
MSMDWEKWAAVVGAGTGIVGMVTGGLGLRAAGKSNGIAQKGNTIARDANDIALDANRKSDVANQISHEALALSQHQDQRETEAHDVRWEGDWIAPGQYALTTHGVHSAHDVAAQVTVDEESVRVERAVVAPGEQIIFDFPEARRVYGEELREHRRLSQQQRAFRVYEPLQFRSHFIEEWAQWKTALGAVKSHESRSGLRTLGDFD